MTRGEITKSLSELAANLPHKVADGNLSAEIPVPRLPVSYECEVMCKFKHSHVAGVVFDNFIH